MNIKNIINKTVSLDNYLCSVDGDRIYDLMQVVYADNGHGQKLERWGASGTVFYTKDEKLAKQAKEISYNNDLEKTKEFLTQNKEHLYQLQDLYAKGLKLMNDKEFHAFKHLSSPELSKDTLKNNTYGCAHLIEDDKILIFYQNHISIREFCNNKNLNIQKNYHEAQAALLKAYKAGKIEPDGQFVGGAVDKVMNSLLDINFVNLSKYQKEMVLLLTEFNDSILVDTKFHTKIEKNKHIASFTQGEKTIKVEIPESKEQDFVVSSDGEIENIRKLSKLLSYVNKEIAQEKVNTFLKRKKM
jgi:predicted nucleic acid-binding protein